MADKYSIGDGDSLKASKNLGAGAGVNPGQFGRNFSGESDIYGGLTKAQVYAVLNSYRREIRACFESALLVRNDLAGTLRLNFTISGSGDVTDVSVVNNEVESNILESCVLQIIKKMEFPKAPNNLPTKVIYPFIFKRSS